MGNIMAAVGGWALSEVGDFIHPTVSKVGTAMKRFGIGAAIANWIAGFIWFP